MWLHFVKATSFSFLLYTWIIRTRYWVILLLLLLFLLLFLGLLFQVSSPQYLTPSSNSFPHRSVLKFQSAAISILCLLFSVQLFRVLDPFLALPFTVQTAVVSARKLTLTEWN
jgi:hypothetical protein